MLLVFCYFVFFMLCAADASNKVVGGVQKGNKSTAGLEKLGSEQIILELQEE